MNNMDYYLHSFLQSKGGQADQPCHRSSYLRLQLVGVVQHYDHCYHKGNVQSSESMEGEVGISVDCSQVPVGSLRDEKATML